MQAYAKDGIYGAWMGGYQETDSSCTRTWKEMQQIDPPKLKRNNVKTIQYVTWLKSELGSGS